MGDMADDAFRLDIEPMLAESVEMLVARGSLNRALNNRELHKERHMALVKTTVGSKKPLAGKIAIAKPAPLKLSLPTSNSVPSNDLNEYSFLFHGEKKIGKTTLSLAEPGVFLMTFDPLQKALAIMQRQIPTWEHFLGYVQLLQKQAAEGNFKYKRVVIDGADIWYRMCQEWACKKLAISHPSEEDWGKGWDLLKTSFMKAVESLLSLPCGVWFISHSKWAEVETRQKGVKIDKLVPLLKQGGEEILVGKIDGWFAYDYDESRRVLIVNGNERVAAGHRVDGHFLTPKGRRIVEIPMGDSPQEAYKNFVDAFNNKQLFITLEERDRSKKGDTPTAPKKPLFKK